MSGSEAPAASTALIRGLRRSGYEPQLTQALASVFRSDAAMAADFVRLILTSRRETDLAADVPSELACATEENIESGRVDLRFSGVEWDLIVELKIHAGYGRQWLKRYLKALAPVKHAHVVAITRDVPLGEPPARADPYTGWLGAVRWRELLPGLLTLRPQDGALAEQWPLFLDVLETEGSMGFTRPKPELFDAFATSGVVMRHMADFLRAIERPLLDALIDSLGGGSAALYRPGTFFWARGGRVDIPFEVPAGGPAGIRVGLVGSVPPTAFFVQPSPGQRWITHFGSLSLEARVAVTKLRQGSFSAREFRAKLPLDSQLLANPNFEERVLGWARARFGEIVDSGLLNHPVPGGKESDPTASDLIQSDEFEVES